MKAKVKEVQVIDLLSKRNIINLIIFLIFYLVSILNKVREELNETAKKSVNYKSYGAYTFDTCKHRCAGGDPNVVFKSPVTKGMTYGFYNFKSQNLNDIRRPIIKCPETKYAESLVMAGVGKF